MLLQFIFKRDDRIIVFFIFLIKGDILGHIKYNSNIFFSNWGEHNNNSWKLFRLKNKRYNLNDSLTPINLSLI